MLDKRAPAKAEPRSFPSAGLGGWPACFDGRGSGVRLAVVSSIVSARIGSASSWPGDDPGPRPSAQKDRWLSELMTLEKDPGVVNHRSRLRLRCLRAALRPRSICDGDDYLLTCPKETFITTRPTRYSDRLRQALRRFRRPSQVNRCCRSFSTPACRADPGQFRFKKMGMMSSPTGDCSWGRTTSG